MGITKEEINIRQLIGCIEAKHTWGSCIDLQFPVNTLMYRFEDHLMTRTKGVKLRVHL